MDYSKLKLSLMVAAFALAGMAVVTADKAEAKRIKLGSTVAKVAVKSAIKANRKRNSEDGSDDDTSGSATATIAENERDAAFKRAAEKLAAERGTVTKTAGEQVNASANFTVNDITCLAGCYK